MITSIHNSRIKWVRALLNNKKERTNSKCFVVEGVRLAEEVLQAGFMPQLVLFSKRLSKRGVQIIDSLQLSNAAIEEISSELLNRVSDTETSQGILMVLHYVNLVFPRKIDFILVLDNIHDPGNLGTILRSATAFGVQAVLLTPGTSDIFAPKIVRSAMGAHFHLPIKIASAEIIQKICKGQSSLLRIYLANAQAGIPCWKLDLTQPLALVIGGEAHGVSQELSMMADKNVLIPMPGGTESINAAISAGILSYEVMRQRKS